MILKAKQLNHRHIGKTVQIDQRLLTYTGKLRVVATTGCIITVHVEMNSTWTEKLSLTVDDKVEVR